MTGRGRMVRPKNAQPDENTASGKTRRARRPPTRRQRPSQATAQPSREPSVRTKRRAPAVVVSEARVRRKLTGTSKGTTEERLSEEQPAPTQSIPVVSSPQLAPPERTTCSTEAIAFIRNVQSLGRLVQDFEAIKQTAKPLALHAANLTAPGVLKEYATSVRTYIPENTSRLHFDKNGPRNRYKDVICAERERVLLKTPGMTDYIHANHVRGPPLNPDQHFICTQGPTASTTLEFWRMVRQEKIEAIVMVASCVELGKPKCFQYWPLQDDEVMRLDAIGIVITNRGRFVHHPGFVTTVLEVKCGKDLLQVLHHQWKTWPDRGVPDRADTVLKVLELVRACPNKSAVAIHCSAGIGRTGTVMAAELGIQALIANRPVDMVELVRQLRQKRMHSVQTDLQYAFIYKVLLSFIATKDPDPETSKALEDFLESFTTMVQNAKLAEQGIPPPAESSGAPASNS